MNVFIQKNDEKRVIQFGEYFAFYGKEVSTLSLAEPSFSFLIDAFAVHMKVFLIQLHTSKFSMSRQLQVITMFNELCSRELGKATRGVQVYNSSVRLIQICLCLFYLEKNEKLFNDLIISSMIEDMARFGNETSRRILIRDCELLKGESETFWEDTDQGNRNIYYSDHKDKLPDFILAFDLKSDSRPVFTPTLHEGAEVHG